MKEKYVFILEVAVLPNLVLDNFENFQLNFDIADSSKRRKQWYNNDTVVGKIRLVQKSTTKFKSIFQ